jgi:hypothetical protein
MNGGVYDKDNRMIAGSTEEGIYNALGLEWIPPEMRENKGEIELARKRDSSDTASKLLLLSNLIQYGSLKGDLQVHSKNTDGMMSIEDIALAAEGGKYPSTEEIPMYPEELLNEFGGNDTFVPLSRDARFLDYQNAQILLTGAREGRDVIKRDIGIEIVEEDETQQSADIFNKLKLRKDQVPIRPLTEGKLE